MTRKYNFWQKHIFFETDVVVATLTPEPIIKSTCAYQGLAWLQNSLHSKEDPFKDNNKDKGIIDQESIFQKI